MLHGQAAPARSRGCDSAGTLSLLDAFTSSWWRGRSSRLAGVPPACGGRRSVVVAGFPTAYGLLHLESLPGPAGAAASSRARRVGTEIIGSGNRPGGRDVTPTHAINLADVEDAAPAGGFRRSMGGPVARVDLEAEQTGVTHFRLRPGKRSPFAHRHARAEEVYVILAALAVSSLMTR